MLATQSLLSLLFAGSAVFWWKSANQWVQRKPLLEWNEGPRSRWRSLPELAVAYVALLSLCLSLRISAPSDVEKIPLTLLSVGVQAAVPLGLTLILILVLALSGTALIQHGITVSGVRDQIRFGIIGFIAAVIPMAVSMIATLPFRGRETQHSLLRLLSESQDVLTVLFVAIAAVVSAPIWEELQFRVVLQGWLSTLFPPRFAIPVVALLFALVHGWRDGLALLPLALILGYVFHRRHSYLTVVVIHALFNATMLALQLLNPQIPE